MNNREENKLSMYNNISSLFKEKQEIISQIPALQELVADFEQDINEIKEEDSKYQSLSKGTVAAKDDSEDALISSVLSFANYLFVIAKKSQNQNLQENSKVTRSSLERLRDNDLLQKAKTIFDFAKSNQENLVNFAVTEEDIKDFEAKINAYEASINEKDTAFRNSKEARKETYLEI